MGSSSGVWRSHVVSGYLGSFIEEIADQENSHVSPRKGVFCEFNIMSQLLSDQHPALPGTSSSLEPFLLSLLCMKTLDVLSGKAG